MGFMLLHHLIVIITYQEIIILKYCVLQRSKVLCQLHFSQVYNCVILNVVI